MGGPRLLVIEHQPTCPPGLVGAWLEDAGVQLDVVRPYDGGQVPVSVDAAGLLVLGGTMSCQDDEAAPWLPATRALIARTALTGQPVLGICLGHQLVSVALGGQVAPNPKGQTTGLRQVGWVDGADPDALNPDDAPRPTAVAHWNHDIVTELPDGAAVLARTADGAPQVVRLAPTVWGVQGHPEATRQIVSGWAERQRERDALHGIDVDAVLAEIEAAGPALEASWRPWTERFATLLA